MFASKFSKLMLKSPAKTTFLCEISRLERKLLSNFLVFCDHRLVEDKLNLAQYFQNFCFQLRHTKTLKCFGIYLEVFSEFV